jgi:hypothetical protein
VTEKSPWKEMNRERERENCYSVVHKLVHLLNVCMSQITELPSSGQDVRVVCFAVTDISDKNYFYPEYDCGMFLRNAASHQPDHTASHATRRQ